MKNIATKYPIPLTYSQIYVIYKGDVLLKSEEFNDSNFNRDFFKKAIEPLFGNPNYEIKILKRTETVNKPEIL